MAAQPAASPPSTGSSSKVVDWAAIVPRSIGREDAMSESQCKVKWGKMMRLANLKTPNESTQNAFKLAVYTYLAVNGTSREGNYAATIQMADGTTFDAAVIPGGIGKSEIRRFMRGEMNNAYEALKASAAVERDERYVAGVGKLGVLPAQAFATADFFDGCALFTPLEEMAHGLARNNSLVRAAKGRGGTLESVERSRVEDSLEAQGAGSVASASRVEGKNIF